MPHSMAVQRHTSDGEGLDLPEPVPGQDGESVHTMGKNSIRVSNVRGYYCHITTKAEFSCPPGLIFALFTNPDNTGVFRDIKQVTSRTVLSESHDGVKEIEIEQLGEVKIMWRPVQFRTRLTVTEDARDPDNLIVAFKLIRSDVLSKFDGQWNLSPMQTEGKRDDSSTIVIFEQDVTPRRVPTFLKHVPFLGGMLRGICVRAVQRTLEDITTALQKVKKGQRWEDVVKPAPQPVHSHKLLDLKLEDIDDDHTRQPRPGTSTSHA